MNQAAKIGIWGFGLVGKSLVNYLTQIGYVNLLVYDQNLSDANLQLDTKAFFTSDLSYLLNSCDYIFPSPGIDLANYQAYAAKFRAEIDLFAQNWHKPVIAITGTLGKTTVTSVLADLLNQAGVPAIAAGNIGLPVCDLLNPALNLAQNCELAVLELSSFQLELCTQLAPDLAIWTNFYANHLDRHKTLVNYFNAKKQIFANQTKNQVALLPINLIPELITSNFKFINKCYLFGLDSELANLDQAGLNFINNNVQGVFVLLANKRVVFRETISSKLVINYLKQNLDQGQVIGNLIDLQTINTYPINLIILLAVFFLKKINLPKSLVFKAIAHRLEHFHTSCNIDWYNDSKSTVPQATLAAVQKLAGRPVIIFLGGTSKGVDRSALILALKDRVKQVICFGGEANFLAHACEQQNLKHAKFAKLETALDYCLKIAEPGDQVLFSPAGASFDLFANYIQRGEIFKQLVLDRI